MKKTTIQELADALNISRVTVWKVFSQRGGVSEQLQKEILAKAEELHYPIPPELKAQLKSEADECKYTISLVISRPKTSLFWMNIIHELAKEASEYKVNLMYTYLPIEIGPDYELPAVFTNDTLQGIVVINVYNEDLLLRLSRLPKPKVFLDTAISVPFQKLNGDLLLIEGKSYVREMTEFLIRRGRKKIGFVGDIHYAVTNYERYEGFLAAMKENGLPISEKSCLLGPIDTYSYQDEIAHFIRHMEEMPEAFVCVSDFVANILKTELTRKNYRIPEDVAICGFDDDVGYHEPSDITTVRVYTPDLGIRLLHQLLYRMSHPKACYECSRICADVIYRKSTDI